MEPLKVISLCLASFSLGMSTTVLIHLAYSRRRYRGAKLRAPDMPGSGFAMSSLDDAVDDLICAADSYARRAPPSQIGEGA